MANQQDRICYLISLSEQLGEPLTTTSLIKGTPITKLCQYDGPGYRRVVDWYKTNIAKNMENLIVDKDTQAVEQFFQQCIAVYKQRNDQYGKSWKVLLPASISNLIEMKANRATRMGIENAKSLDEAIDIANYAAMLHITLNK